MYAALLAHGTELDTASVAFMIPELSHEAIADAMRLLEDEGPLREANELVVQFLHRHEVVKTWGEGTLASSDAMSLEASRYLWNARVDPRRRTYAMGIYSHVLDQWGMALIGFQGRGRDEVVQSDFYHDLFLKALTFQ